jgi:hypothetical protein
LSILSIVFSADCSQNLVRSWASAEVKVRLEGRLKSLEVLFKVGIKVSAYIAVAR